MAACRTPSCWKFSPTKALGRKSFCKGVRVLSRLPLPARAGSRAGGRGFELEKRPPHPTPLLLRGREGEKWAVRGGVRFVRNRIDEAVGKCNICSMTNQAAY